MAALLGVKTVNAAEAEPAWTSIFPGANFTGWTRYLRDQKPDVDPKGVYRIVQENGESLLRISGEVAGGITTNAEYENYHLQVEFKWGEARYGYRANLPRDSGILYHGKGEPNRDSAWLESIEFGILEGGETGDYYSVPGPLAGRMPYKRIIVMDVEGEDIPLSKRRY